MFSKIGFFFKSLYAWAAKRAMQDGIVEDDELNALMFQGDATMTTSTHSALAWRAEEKAGRFGWGCIMCKWVLAIIVTKTHCQDTLDNKAIPTVEALRALVAIEIVLWTIRALMIGIPIGIAYLIYLYT